MVASFSIELAVNVLGRQTRVAIWPVVGAAFILQPALTLALALLMAWRLPAGSPRRLEGLVLLGAAYLALINVTKLPESDLAAYLEVFESAQRLDLTTFLLLNTREPLYYVSLYGLANLPGSDGRIYVFLSTLIPYFIFGAAVLQLGKALQVERKALLSLLIFLLFLPQLFSLSAHLLRQFLASSLAMFFLATHATTGRRPWGLGVVAMMIHYSSIPLLLLSLVRPLRRFSSMANTIIYSLTLLGVYALAVKLAPLLLDLPILGIVFQRLAGGEGATLDPLTMPALATAALFFAVALFSLVNSKAIRLGAQDWSILLGNIVVCVVVLVSSVQSALSEIAVRYFFYLYFLIVMEMAFLIRRVPLTSWVVHALGLFSVPLFFYKLAYGEWTFAPIASLLLEPAWMLWSHLDNSPL